MLSALSTASVTSRSAIGVWAIATCVQVRAPSLLIATRGKPHAPWAGRCALAVGGQVAFQAAADAVRLQRVGPGERRGGGYEVKSAIVAVHAAHVGDAVVADVDHAGIPDGDHAGRRRRRHHRLVIVHRLGASEQRDLRPVVAIVVGSNCGRLRVSQGGDFKRWNLDENKFIARIEENSEDLDNFVACYNPANRHKRRESELFKAFSYDDLLTRDKVSLDIFWLNDESLEDAANLPDPSVGCKTPWTFTNLSMQPLPRRSAAPSASGFIRSRWLPRAR